MTAVAPAVESPATVRQEYRLRFLCRVNPPTEGFAQLADDAPVTFLPLDAVWPGSDLDMSQERLKGEVAQGYTRFRSGDILLPKITPTFEAARSALLPELPTECGAGSTELHVLRPGPLVDARYLRYVLLSQPFLQNGVAAMTGVAGQQRVPEEFVKNVVVQLPPRKEQEATADYLDREVGKLDQLVQTKRRLLALLRERRAAAMTEVVLDVGHAKRREAKGRRRRHIADTTIPSHWDVLPLRRVVSKFIDYRGATPEKVLTGVRLVTARNVKEGRIDFDLGAEYVAEGDYDTWMRRGLPVESDVLLTTEAPLGEVAQITETRIALAQRIILLRADRGRMLSDYLKYYLWSSVGQAELSSRATGSTALGIKAERLKDVLVVVPPLDEQERGVTHLDDVCGKIGVLLALVQQQLARLAEHRSALITAVVDGTYTGTSTEEE
jgi:type I restriction enzyme S subunit